MENKIIALRQVTQILILGDFLYEAAETESELSQRLDMKSKVDMKLPLINVFPQLGESKLNFKETM